MGEYGLPTTQMEKIEGIRPGIRRDINAMPPLLGFVQETALDDTGGFLNLDPPDGSLLYSGLMIVSSMRLGV